MALAWSTSTRMSGEPAALQFATMASNAALVQCCTVPLLGPPSRSSNSPTGESCTRTVSGAPPPAGASKFSATGFP